MQRSYFITSLIATLFVGTVLGFFVYDNFNKLHPSNSESAPIAQNTTSSENIYRGKTCLTTANSYSYGKTRATLVVLSDCQDLLRTAVTGGLLFVENKDRKILLDTDIGTYLDIPKFATTTRPDVIGLTSSFADAGAYSIGTKYIDMTNLNLVYTRETGDGLSIYHNPQPARFSGNYYNPDPNGKEIEPIGEIALVFAESPARDDLSLDTALSASSATTTITGLMVNDKEISITPHQTYCTVNYASAGIDCDARISFKGVGRDMNKIYFSIGDVNNEDGWQIRYSFDLNSKTVQEEVPHDML